MRRRKPPILVLLVAATLLLWPAAPVSAAPDQVEEYAVKAALVFNFARFTDWPDGTFRSEDAPLRVCVFGGDGLREAFAAIDGRLIEGHPMQVHFTTNVRQLADSHLIFVPQTAREQWQQIRAALGERPVLTVGEMNGFLESGGMMNLVLEDNRIVFQVNRAEVKRAGLAISARILKLASVVLEEEDAE